MEPNPLFYTRRFCTPDFVLIIEAIFFIREYWKLRRTGFLYYMASWEGRKTILIGILSDWLQH